MENSGAPHGSGAGYIADLNRAIFFSILDSFSGLKVIVWDPRIIKRFDLIAKSEELRQHDVASMLIMGSGPVVTSAEHNSKIYIVSSEIEAADEALKHVKHATSKNDRSPYHVLFVPDASASLKERLLEDKEASLRLKTIASLPLRIYPVYDDFFTLFLPRVAAKLLMNKDWTELHRCASAILQIQSLCTRTPNLRCCGKWAAQAAKIFKELNEKSISTFLRREWDVSDIVIIDRWLDPLTPILHQYTYGGLIDEVFHILPSGGIMTKLFPNGATSSSTEKETPLYDDLYRRLRDLHMSDVGKAISAEVKEVKELHQELKETWVPSLTQAKVFVRRLKEMGSKEKAAEKHTVIADYLISKLRDDLLYKKITRLEREILIGSFGDRVIPFIEDLIISSYPHEEKILCLLVLQCLVAGGLKPSTYAAYQRLFIQSYGIFKMAFWLKLEMAGLLYPKQTKIKCDYAAFDFHYVNKRFGCTDQPISVDVAYPYCGYSPPLVRHIESGVKNGWKDWTSVTSPEQTACEPESTTVVFVIGGLTMAEAACLRRIKFPNHLVIFSSNLCTGRQLLESICSIK